MWIIALTAQASELATTYALEFGADTITPDLVEVGATYKRLCEAGDSTACASTWGAGDLEQAATLLEPLCEEQPVACMVVAWHKKEAAAAQDKVDPDVPGLHEKACTGGVERACVEWGKTVESPAYGEPDGTKALSLYQTACQQGEMAGCRQLGKLYHGGRLVPRDIDKALTYYTQACEAGYAGGCNSVGLVNHVAVDRDRDIKVAALHYIKACDAKHEPACNNLRKLYLGGIRPDEDPTLAMEVLSEGCDRKEPAACSRAAQFIGTTDPTAGVAFLEKGCALKDPFTCGQLGAVLVATDFERGSTLLEASCIAGLPSGCATLGGIYGQKGENLNLEKAVEFWRPACEAKHGPSCLSLATAAKKGKGMDKDKALAGSYREMACEAGVEEACK